ncbi:hypothetical protein [Microvirga sp. 2TAF3]|uniref:hypothetical protein n=1 Tax=Microvirga sp. 2TAF3 TaxID=3233014 RepID=UPI003F96EA19
MSKPPLRASNAQSLEKDGVRPLESDASSAETAQYIAEFAAELSFMARKSKLDLLAYLLDMARMEAIRTVQCDARRP